MYGEPKGIGHIDCVLYWSVITRDTHNLLKFRLASTPMGFEPGWLYVVRYGIKIFNVQLADLLLFCELNIFIFSWRYREFELQG
jgi:hypothetical protein